MNKERKTTIVIVTHNGALANSMPRMVTLRDGRVESDERRTTAPGETVVVETGKVDVGGGPLSALKATPAS